MSEHPILFCAEMVRAYLAGRKSQARRVIKLPRWSTETWSDFEIDDGGWPVIVDYKTGCLARVHCPYGVAGDSLWTKETWRIVDRDFDPGIVRVGYKATPEPNSTDSQIYTQGWSPWIEVGNDYASQFNKRTDRENGIWRPSIFMPRWASRISFPVLSIRAEIVQEISEADAEAEGVAYHRVEGSVLTARKRYKYLWNTINAKRGYGWDVQPWWVWVIEFPKYGGGK